MLQDDSANIEEEHFQDPNDEEGEGEDNEVEIIGEVFFFFCFL